ncbi:MAG: Uncharacterized protein LiPW16_120, partial [Microgenomates group bacterium LiPW_16]
KLMMPAAPVSNAPTGKEPEKSEDMSKIMQKQMNLLLPLMIGWFAFSFPVGLSVYWNTFTVFGIIQQLKIKNEK